MEGATVVAAALPSSPLVHEPNSDAQTTRLAMVRPKAQLSAIGDQVWAPSSHASHCPRSASQWM